MQQVEHITVIDFTLSIKALYYYIRKIYKCIISAYKCIIQNSYSYKV